MASEPITRESTLPAEAGSISGTAAGLLTGLARRKPTALLPNDEARDSLSADDKPNEPSLLQWPPRV